MTNAMFIVWRETIEAMLVIGILHGWVSAQLVDGLRRHAFAWLWGGVGAGLGLAIVRSFVSLHGGSIAIERRDPRGSRVVVSLPIDGVAAGGRAATAAE